MNMKITTIILYQTTFKNAKVAGIIPTKLTSLTQKAVSLVSKLVLTVLFIPLYSNCIKAQSSSADLDIGNIKATINSNGCLFNNGSVGYSPGFEVPKSSGSHTIYTNNLWIGGFDGGGNIKLAAETYRQNGTDIWPGPLDNNAVATATTSAYWNKVWKINKSSIDSFKLWNNNPSAYPNYTVPSSILNWPANPYFTGESVNLAPYHDGNGNGIYDPDTSPTGNSAIDYPCIKGDQAIYFMYNDAKIHTESGGTPIGVEIHGMAYSFSITADSALNNTVFVNYKIINRSNVSLDSCYIGNWTDLDVGNPFDDFIGCNVEKNFYYGYNGDNFDEDYNGLLGYGSKPPAQGIVFLKGPLADVGDGLDNDRDGCVDGTKDGANCVPETLQREKIGMSKFVYYKNDFSVIGNPTQSSHYYNYLSGKWKDASNFTYGGDGYNELTNIKCDFMFPGSSDPVGWGVGGNIQNPNPQANWDEATVSNTPGDRRGLGSYGPFTFETGEELCIDFAYVFSRGNTNLASVTKLETDVDHVTNYFNSNLASCDCSGSVIAGIAKTDLGNTIFMYPNPATDNLSIKFERAAKNPIFEIIDLTGKQVATGRLENKINNIDIGALAAGLYFVKITDDTAIYNSKFLKE